MAHAFYRRAALSLLQAVASSLPDSLVTRLLQLSLVAMIEVVTRDNVLLWDTSATYSQSSNGWEFVRVASAHLYLACVTADGICPLDRGQDSEIFRTTLTVEAAKARRPKAEGQQPSKKRKTRPEHRELIGCIVTQPENRKKAIRGLYCARSAVGSVLNRISVGDDKPADTGHATVNCCLRKNEENGERRTENGQNINTAHNLCSNKTESSWKLKDTHDLSDTIHAAKRIAVPILSTQPAAEVAAAVLTVSRHQAAAATTGGLSAAATLARKRIQNRPDARLCCYCSRPGHTAGMCRGRLRDDEEEVYERHAITAEQGQRSSAHYRKG
jgi:hypothetical protein